MELSVRQAEGYFKFPQLQLEIRWEGQIDEADR